MQLPNLGALSLHPAVSAPGPDVVEIDEPDDENVQGVEVNPGDDDDGEYLEVGADDVVTHEHEEEDDEEDEAAALAALNASGFGAAERELIERKKQEEAPRWTVESKSSKRKPKSEAEKEAARLERNRKQRERNAAKSEKKSVEGVVERLLKEVEAQNAPAKKPEVIDLTVDDDEAPEETKKKRKKKKMTWWMIREEDPRKPKERHPLNKDVFTKGEAPQGSYDRLEPRKGSKGPRFKAPVPESDDEQPPSPRTPPTRPY